MILHYRHSRARLSLLATLVALLLVAGLGLGGCTRQQPDAQAPTEEPVTEKPTPIKIGTLPTEDSLPLWVAEQKGYFAEQELESVEIVVFQSAQERDAAFTAGSIDAYMGDIIAAANLEAAGSKGTILTVMLGADPAQGRFGIVAGPKSDVATASALAGVPVGTSSATIQEYVLDGLMAEAGVPADKVKKEEVKKVPVRFELLMQGKLKAAALPEPFISLAEQSGGKVLADDTTSEKNLSQTVLVVSDEFLAKSGGTATADAVLSAWDKAAADINADPASFRTVLVEKARLPKPLEGTYEVNEYPTSQLPAKEEVDAVLSWMKDKGYLKEEVTFEDLTLVLPEG